MNVFSPKLFALILSLSATSVLANPDTIHHDHTKPTTLTQTTPSDAPLPVLDSLSDDKPLDLKIPHMVRFMVQGVPVIFTPIHELPILDVSLKFKGGSAKDNTIHPNAQGVAGMTAIMMTQGTTHLDEQAFAEKAELLGASFSAFADLDSFNVEFRSLSEDQELTPALDLLVDMIQNPRFDDAILTRNQNQLDVGFEYEQQDPSQLAYLTFLKTLYGTHPYATPSVGTRQSIKNIRRDDLIAYKNKYLTQGNVHIAITGDISHAQASAIASRLVAALPQGDKASDLPTPTPPKPQHIHLNHDSEQTHVYIGHMGEKHTKDPKTLQERTNFRLGNMILAGGDLNTRLMSEIRKKGGYTYGIYGGAHIFDERGYYLINFSTQSDKAAQAIEKTLHVINDTRKNGVSDSELTQARTHHQYAYPMSLATNLAIHRTASNLNYRHLPDSHISDYLVRLNHASLADVNHALNTHIRPDKFIIITIGKQKPDLSHLFDKTQKPKNSNQKPKK